MSERDDSPMPGPRAGEGALRGWFEHHEGTELVMRGRGTEDQRFGRAAVQRLADFDRSERATGRVWREGPERVIIKRESIDYRPRSVSPIGRYVRPEVAQQHDRVLRDPGEPRDVDPGTVDRRGVKRERVKDAFSTNISRIEGRVKEDPEANILMTHAKWQKTQDGYTLNQTPYPYKGREARRIYLE